MPGCGPTQLGGSGGTGPGNSTRVKRVPICQVRLAHRVQPGVPLDVRHGRVALAAHSADVTGVWSPAIRSPTRWRAGEGRAMRHASTCQPPDAPTLFSAVPSTRPRRSRAALRTSREPCGRACTRHAPRTTHHAPRTTHHAPRSRHHTPRTTHPRTTHPGSLEQTSWQGPPPPPGPSAPPLLLPHCLWV